MTKIETMDFRAFIGAIAEHYLVLTGTTLALFFTTCMVLLIRSIGQKSESDQVTTTIDVDEIEGAMKRVLAAQAVIAVSGSATGSMNGSKSINGRIESTSPEQNGGSGADHSQIADPTAVSDLHFSLAEKDTRIGQLQLELSELKTSKGPSGGEGTEHEAYKVKIGQLEARLAEYEIIEDDIADLSLFKEENIRLKDEIVQLKLTKPPVALTSIPPSPSLEIPKAQAAPVPSSEVPLSTAGDMIKEFAEAVEQQLAPALDPNTAIDALLMADSASADQNLSMPVLDEMPDHAKLLSEVESLALNTSLPGEPSAGQILASDTALDETLDTEKLLAEVDSLGIKSSAS